MNEAVLRDLLARDISKLKRGLTLLQKEQYIPNRHGAKGFIDLYAKDEDNRHVLIELKRVRRLAGRHCMKSANISRESNSI